MGLLLAEVALQKRDAHVLLTTIDHQQGAANLMFVIPQHEACLCVSILQGDVQFVEHAETLPTFLCSVSMYAT